MPKLVPLQSIVVIRPDANNGNKPVRFTPEIGKPFEFTADEVKQITGANPDAFTTKATVELTPDDGKVIDPNADAKKISDDAAVVTAAAGKAGGVKPKVPGPSSQEL